jgi:hypothetical protein
MKLTELTTEELRELSMQKGRKGNASGLARQAQQVLWNRTHPFSYGGTTPDNCPYGGNETEW